jgi:competence protein ComEC
MAGSRVLSLALLAVLLLDPWAVLAAGFWLSFGAVALLFYIGSGRLGPAHWLAEWGRAQWAVTLGMLPALLALFQQFSLVSPLANALAIPLVSLVVTPLVLLGSLPLLDPLLALAHLLMAWMMVCIDWLAALPLAMWQQAAPAPWAVLLALAGGLWLLLPRGFPARWLGVLAFLPLLTVEPPRPAAGTAAITVLDVGQGLAIHVQTAGHDLLFDAGPAFSADADSGNRIIVPYLRAAGVRRLDAMVISHADKDHEGGASSVLAALPVALLKTSLPFEHALSAQPVPHEVCRDGDAWEWDGVRFEMLHPGADPLSRKSNDLSCVLRIAVGGRAMLLTSDIEAVSEASLLARHADRLPAAAMTVPHHGSRTSSTGEFVAAVGARDVVFPVGYRNRFGHPKEEVVARYAASGARLHRTDADGAVAIVLSAQGLSFRHERAERRRYWHASGG